MSLDGLNEEEVKDLKKKLDELFEDLPYAVITKSSGTEPKPKCWIICNWDKLDEDERIELLYGIKEAIKYLKGRV